MSVVRERLPNRCLAAAPTDDTKSFTSWKLDLQGTSKNSRLSQFVRV